jgi:hypothetical protein
MCRKYMSVVALFSTYQSHALLQMVYGCAGLQEIQPFIRG